MLVSPLLLLAWAIPHTSPSVVDDAASLSGNEATPWEMLSAPNSATSGFTDFAFDPQASPAAPMPPPPRPRGRFVVKGGYFDSSEDGFEDGANFVVSWIRPISKNLSSEVEIGYLDASGTDNGVDRDVWSISFLGNVRASVPIGKRLELYGGLGIGTFYYDADADFGAVSASTDGFLIGGDGYFGGSIHVGESLTLGLEGKYYVTDSSSDLDGGLDGFVALLTVGFDM